MNKFLTSISILFTFVISHSQTTSIQFTYDAAGNRTGRQIVIEPINETDSVVDTTAVVQEKTLNQVQGDVVQGEILKQVQDDVLQQPLINEILAIEAETLQLQVFPNPTYGRLNINLNGALPEQALQVAVTNAGGSMLFTQDLLFSSNTLNLSHLPAGVYYLNIVSEGKKLKDYKVVKL